MCCVFSEVADMLKLENLVSPAGPARVEVACKQLQTFGTGANVRLQHGYSEERKIYHTWYKMNNLHTDRISRSITALGHLL